MSAPVSPAERLRELGAIEHNQLGEACDAGAAALDEVATLRATIDGLDCTRRELGDTLHCRLDARCQRCELTALRARLTQLEAALQSIANSSCCGPCQEAKLVARAALTPEGT